MCISQGKFILAVFPEESKQVKLVTNVESEVDVSGIVGSNESFFKYDGDRCDQFLHHVHVISDFCIGILDESDDFVLVHHDFTLLVRPIERWLKLSLSLFKIRSYGFLASQEGQIFTDSLVDYSKF